MNDVGFIFGPLLWGFWEIALWYQGGDGFQMWGDHHVPISDESTSYVKGMATDHSPTV